MRESAALWFAICYKHQFVVKDSVDDANDGVAEGHIMSA